MLAIALVSVLTAAALPQNTWTVDANNGPGTNFTDLPAAVAVAQNGDTIVVRAGAYSDVTISNLAVTIRGVIGLTTISSAGGAAVRVDSQPVGTTTTLSGLVLNGRPSLAFDAARVVLTDVSAIAQVPRGSGLEAVGSEVHATRCSFIGSNNALAGPFMLVVGGDGARIAAGAKLLADNCTFEGGDAGPLAQGTSIGGYGLIVSGEAWLNRCQVSGGDGFDVGGSGAYALGGDGVIDIAGTPTSCLCGGAGLIAGNSAVGNFTGVVVVHDPVPVASTSGNVIVGEPEMPYLSVTGSSLPSGALLANVPVAIAYEGVIPNAPYFLVVGFAPDYSAAFSPLLLGPMLVDINNASLTLGTLDSNASFSESFVPANLVGLTIYAQAGTFDVVRGEFRVSNGSVVRFDL